MPVPLFRARLTTAGALIALGGCEPADSGHTVSVRTAGGAAPAPLAVGDTLLLVAEARSTIPHQGFAPPLRRFRWRSADARAAEVSGRGVVVARGAGAATIFADFGGRGGGLALTVGPARPGGAAAPAPVALDGAAAGGGPTR